MGLSGTVNRPVFKVRLHLFEISLFLPSLFSAIAYV
jgi:hypothetical protein